MSGAREFLLETDRFSPLETINRYQWIKTIPASPVDFSGLLLSQGEPTRQDSESAEEYIERCRLKNIKPFSHLHITLPFYQDGKVVYMQNRSIGLETDFFGTSRLRTEATLLSMIQPGFEHIISVAGDKTGFELFRESELLRWLLRGPKEYQWDIMDMVFRQAKRGSHQYETMTDTTSVYFGEMIRQADSKAVRGARLRVDPADKEGLGKTLTEWFDTTTRTHFQP